MSSLREQVYGFVFDDMGDPHDATDRIIAAFEAALLQPEVVEAAAKGLWDAESDGEPVREWHGGVTGAHPGMARYYRDQARAALQAALTALHGTDTGDGQRGDE